MTLSATEQQLAFQLLETIGEEIVKAWLASRSGSTTSAAATVKPSDATDKATEVSDTLEQDDASADKALESRFPANTEPGK